MMTTESPGNVSSPPPITPSGTWAPPPQPTTKRPVGRFFFINAAVLFVDFIRSAASATGLQALFLLFFSVAYLVFIAIVMALVHLIIRNRRVRPWLAATLYLIPTILLVLSALVSQIPGVQQPMRKPTQQSSLASPSGMYSVRVSDPPGGWCFEILDADGEVLLSDHTDFSRNVNVYWYWSNDDRLWCHNSDDGRMWFWEFSDGAWKRHLYDKKDPALAARGIKPPREL